MKQCFARVLSVEVDDPRHVVLTFRAPEIARTVKPGQFVNILVNDLGAPFLRRPFSLYATEGDTAAILFNVVGGGTAQLARKKAGDEIDLIGPLGHPFTIDDSFETAILVGGGLGVAALPLLARALQAKQKPLVTFLGARDAGYIFNRYLTDAIISTDDGSAGFHGTVVDSLRLFLKKQKIQRPKIFACGPNPMLRAISQVSKELAIPCEVSLESAMACGIGICQGCPVELAGPEKKYALVCKDGTVFDAQSLRWDYL